MEQSPRVDVDGFWKNGYTIVRGVFSPEEAEGFRKAIIDSPEHEGDMLSHPSPVIRKVLLDKRLLDIGQRILGDKLIYFGDSTAKVGFFGRGYHKDNADRHDYNAPDWQGGRYTLIRFGLYLQDHTRHSGGLNIRSGSHNWTDLNRGRTVYMNTSPGDVVVWTLRTTHSANGRLLKGPLRGLHLAPIQLHYVPKILIAPDERERVAMFFTVAKDDQHLKRYIDYVKTRAYMIELWKRSTWDPEVVASAAGLPIELRDVWSQIRDQPGLGVNKDYTAIPY